MIPDGQARCRCGRSTVPVKGSDNLRTCSKCGYMTSYCKCKNQSPVSALSSLRMPGVSERTRTIIGAATVSSMGTLFFVTMLSSPFVAVFGPGIPFGLSAAFFTEWLREERPPIASGNPMTVEQAQKTRVPKG